MNRRAQLQRKLALKEVPKPPADLAQRIKNDIPQHMKFNAEEERERFGNSIAMNIGVAASVLVLIATGFLALRIVSQAPQRQNAPQAAVAARRAIDVQPEPVAPLTVSEPPTLAAPATEIVRPPKKHPAATDRVAAASPVPSASSEREPVAESGAPSAPVPAAAQAASRATADMAAPQKASAKRSVAIDDAVIQRMTAPAALPTGVALDVEASDEPLTPAHVVVRASVDCGMIVHDLWVDVLLNDEARGTARWLAYTARGGASTFANASRTTLVEFALPSTSSDAPLATIRVTYRDENGQHAMEKTITRADIRSWSDASRRLRGGTLAALWRYGYADDATIASAARAAGFDDLADAIEKR